ncbi:MAG: cupin domain-containing protein [Flavobacteriales bacterium]|nr:cupin domain-containing protein [Flavobacteriales bacterium]
MLQPAALAQFARKPSVENSIWYNGHRFSYLVRAAETGGAFTLFHCHFRKGGEPPAHYHKVEDETFYVLEGEIRFHIGDQRYSARAGELAHVPKGVPHQFSLVTDTAKALMLISPSGMETFFEEFSVPARSLELPPVPEGKPPAEFFEHMTRRATELGMVWMPEF